MADDTHLPYKEYKIIILGESYVGKTSLLQRYMDIVFEDNSISTIGVDLLTKDEIIDNKKIRFNFWDTAGQEKCGNLAKVYYMQSNGVILVCDTTNKESLDKLNKWILDMDEFLDEKKTELIIIVNKKDLEKNRQLTDKKVIELAKKKKCEVFFTSAKTGEGVKEAFNYLKNRLINNKEIQCVVQDDGNSQEKSRNRTTSFKVRKNNNNDNEKNKRCNC